MKRILPVLSILIITLFLSSCILIAKPIEEETYTFYFFNDTNKDVRDWYLIDEYGNEYSKIDDGLACPIDSGEIQSIKKLKKRLYQVYYEYYDRESHYTSYSPLDSDTTFRLSDLTFYVGAPRTAEAVAE